MSSLHAAMPAHLATSHQLRISAKPVFTTSSTSRLAGAVITSRTTRAVVSYCARFTARAAIAAGNDEESCSMSQEHNGVFQARNGSVSRRLVLQMAPLVVAGAAAAAAADETPAITRKVFMDVAIEGQPIGRIVIGLYGDAVPLGTQRFAELATGKRGIGYRRKEFYKITKHYVQNVGVRGFSLTGGTEDAARFTGGETADALVDEMVRLDELRLRPRHARGSVSLVALDPTRPPPKTKLVAKDGGLVVVEEEARPAPNGTEFMIAVADAPELDATNSVVGEVVEGMDVVDRIHGVKVVNENTSSPYFQVAKLIGDSRAVVAEKGFNRPYEKVLIAKCGEFS